MWDCALARGTGSLQGVEPTYAAGIINYRSYEDLARCLDALAAQEHPPVLTLVVDVDPDRAAPASLRNRPGVHWVESENRGFAGGANLALAELSTRTSSLFLLLMNPDVELDRSFAAQLLAEMVLRPRTALGTGKLLRPDGTLDAAGVELPRSRRPRNRGEGEPDQGLYDEVDYVWGASGAAMMLRSEALSDLSIDGEIFDEDFFLYHEDTDLSWRAQLLGWRVLYVPQARAVHVRRWRRSVRLEIPTSIRRHSFKNHYLQLIKNEGPRDFWLGLPVLAGWELLRLGSVLLRDPGLLRGYLDAWRLSGRAWEKRRLLRAAIRDRG